MSFDAGALVAQASADLHAGRLDEADAAAEALAELEGTRVTGLRLMAQVRTRRGAVDEALALLAAACEAAPRDPAPLVEAAGLLQWQGRQDEAMDCYRRANALDPSDGYVRELLSQGLLDRSLQLLTGRRLGREASKSHAARVYSGFVRTRLSGRNVLDVGYRGGFGETDPVVPHAIGVDVGYPGYDGVHLPFPDGSQDAVYTSHCLEHVPDTAPVIREWFRVLRTGGYLVTIVPHQFLYERRRALPARNPEHCHLFTPGTLLAAFEQALARNSYRVRHLADNDLFYDYSLPNETHPVGCYEIELVIERIAQPAWQLD
jgi:SAM-dependent methyltransferase